MGNLDGSGPGALNVRFSLTKSTQACLLLNPARQDDRSKDKVQKPALPRLLEEVNHRLTKGAGGLQNMLVCGKVSLITLICQTERQMQS